MARRAAKPTTYVVTMTLAGLVAALMLVAGPVSTASAADCDTSWATGDGDWTKVANWTNGLPGVNGPNVCITAPGTYTVHVTAREGDFNNSIANAPNLILGGASGQQTVAVDGTFTDQTAGASLAVGAGTIGANGRIVLNSNDPNHVAGASLCAGTGLTNEGTLQIDAGTGGGRTILGTLVNKAIMNVNGDLSVPSFHSCGGNSLVNAGGTINIATGKTLTDTESFKQSAGTTNVSGSLHGSGGFTVEGGTFTGNSPVLNTPLIFSPSGGSGTFVVHGNSGFGSSIGAGITVIAEATASEDTLMNFRAETNPATNAGTVQLTSEDNAHTATLQGPESAPASLTNIGTIETLPGSGGGRTLGLGLTNEGTIKIDANTDGSCCSSSLHMVNKGTLTIDAGKLFSLGGAPFTQTEGNTKVNGEMTGAGNSLFAISGGSFTGNPPVLTGKILTPTGGSGTFVIHGPSGFASDIGKGITLVVEATSENAILAERAEANGSTNEGTIRLTSTDPGHSAELSAANADPDSLFNAGTIETLPGVGGARWLNQAITNKGTGAININADTSGFFMRVANAGTINVAAGKTLSFGEPLTQTSGALVVNGTLTTGPPVTIEGGVLRGAGTVTASTVSNSGGTVQPGNPPGTLAISGDYTQGAAGTFATAIAGSTPGSGYSRLAVSGNATLDGTLDVTNGFAPATGQTFQILTAGGTRSGAFSTTTVHGEPGYDVQYNPAEVTLVAHALPMPPTPPASGSSSPTAPPPIATDNLKPKPLKCKKGAKKKRVKGKAKCVKIKPKKKHKH